MNRPQIGDDGVASFLMPSRLGHPIFGCRSRMSDGRRFRPDLDACEAVERFVAGHGGPRFFDRPDADRDLAPLLARVSGHYESEETQAAAIERELADARDQLEARLAVTVRHVCLPWGVTGRITRRTLERLGFRTAFANRLSGRLAVGRHDDPFFLKRLHARHVFALPGRGRRVFTTLA